MARPEKIASVAEIRERIEQNEIAIATQYVGINVAQATELRKRLRDQGVDYKVYKNTLALRALRELNLENAGTFMYGPTAWAFSKDPVTPAKILRDFSKEVDKVKLAGGILNGRLLSAADLDALASLPSREQLLAQVVGTIAAPLRDLVGTLSAVPRNLVGVIDQIRKQKEEQGAAA